MAVTPSTNLKLLKNPLLMNNKNQLTFANLQAQFNYFNSLTKLECENFSYQRKDNIIRFPAHIDDIMEYNYCMYQNDNYSDKWFYAFISNMTYVNDSLTEITIVTDVFQTWLFDFQIKQSFVEREMINVSDDQIGANRINEGLETGEYVVKNSYNISDLENYYIIAYVGESIKVVGGAGISTPQRGYKYNGIYSSVCFILCNDDGFNYLMNLMSIEDNSNNILTIFTIPKLAVNTPISSSSWQEHGFNVINENLMSTPKYLSNETFEAITTNTNFENYTPKNKKLLQYPYIYLAFNPLVGTSKIFRYEDFANNQPYFQAISEINPNPSVYFIPHNYRKPNKAESNVCVEDSCSMGGYPNISYKTDVFNTWLAQNQGILNLTMQSENNSYQQQTINNNVDMVKNAVSTGINTASGLTSKNSDNQKQGVSDLVSGMLTAVSQGLNQGFLDVNHELNIQMQMAQIEKQRMLPDNANLSSSNATIMGYGLLDNSVFTSYCIKREFAERIDKYFDMYGYKTNTVKVPNLNNRPNWNYVKTINCNIAGFIPQADLIAIKQFFDNGITLWHNPATFLDYSQNNR